MASHRRGRQPDGGAGNLSGAPVSAWRTWLQFGSQDARSTVVRLRMLRSNVYIGEGTRIPGCGDPSRPVIAQGVSAADPVRIGAGCLNGIGVSLMPGEQLGPGYIVGAGSVVRRSFPRDSIVAGLLARLTRHRFDHGG